MPSERTLTRRKFLGTAAGSTTAALAGCLGEQRPLPTEQQPIDGDRPAGSPTRTRSPTETPHSSNGSGSWSQFGAGPRNTGHAPDVSGPGSSDAEIAWRYDAGTPTLNASPVVADGTVYVPGSGDPGLVHAVDAASGEQVWEFEPAGYVTSAPALVDDTLYFGTWGKEFYAVDAGSGEPRWRREVGHRFGASSPAVADGVVYVAASSQRVCMGVGGGESTCSGVTRGRVYAVDASTGDERWTAEIETDTRSSPAVADGTVYVGCADGLSAVTTDGDRAWRVGFESGEDSLYVDSSPAVAGGTVYVGASDGRLRAVGPGEN